MDTFFRIFKKSITVKVCSCHLVAFYRKTINALVFGNKFIADVMKTSKTSTYISHCKRNKLAVICVEI